MDDSSSSVETVAVSVGEMPLNTVCLFMPDRFYRFLLHQQSQVLRNYCYGQRYFYGSHITGDFTIRSAHPIEVFFALSFVFEDDASLWTGRAAHRVFANMIACARSFEEMDWVAMMEEVVRLNRLDPRKGPSVVQIDEFFARLQVVYVSPVSSDFEDVVDDLSADSS